jgi:hypothetical protein
LRGPSTRSVPSSARSDTSPCLPASWPLFRLGKNFNPMNSTTFVLFDKYCPIVDQLGSKDSSRDLQLNCVISYFLPTFNTLYKWLKIDMMERVKKLGILMSSKQGLDLEYTPESRRRSSGLMSCPVQYMRSTKCPEETTSQYPCHIED